jgi:hypothetical protein
VGASPPLSFDAASVKVDNSGSSSSNWDDHPGRMTVKNATLRSLIERAYELQAHQIVGPGWLASEHYDIEAEMPLAFHREQKVMPVYLLVAAKASAEDAAPSIFTALREQLGLELVRSKAPVELFVIDRVDKTPTEN